VKDGRPAQRTDHELRCGCGSLMARRTTAGLELKCRRCKRVVVVPVDATRDDWIEVSMR
jgi:phage FluMu protein Com